MPSLVSTPREVPYHPSKMRGSRPVVDGSNVLRREPPSEAGSELVGSPSRLGTPPRRLSSRAHRRPVQAPLPLRSCLSWPPFDMCIYHSFTDTSLWHDALLLQVSIAIYSHGMAPYVYRGPMVWRWYHIPWVGAATRS
ncbi:hypothetical protein JB92DRAFT_1884537 [Gautieria morchelliformis]|nr:hypothetical protein JB92DRAFT_1884537 [Gautieria morchelliformis]